MRHFCTCFTAVVAFVAQAARLFALRARQPGQGLVEYALILVAISVVCIGIMTTMGTTVSQIWYNQIVGAFP